MQLTPDDIREIGQALYGDQWKAPLARSLDINRQGVDHYLKAGVSGVQAAAILGVVARTIMAARREEMQRRADYDAAEAEMLALQARFDV